MAAARRFDTSAKIFITLSSSAVARRIKPSQDQFVADEFAPESRGTFLVAVPATRIRAASLRLQSHSNESTHTSIHRGCHAAVAFDTT